MSEPTQVLKTLSTMGIPTNVDDSNIYIGDDGLPYCKNCHTLRVTKEIVPVLNRRMPVWCECMKERERKGKEKDLYMRKMSHLSRLKTASLLGERYSDVTFDKTDLTANESFIKAFNRCKKYCEITDTALAEGYGIYLFGDSGTGKTHLTACMCNELINQFQECLFTNFFEISKLIKATWGKNTDASNIIKKICEVDFLFIDDLGTEKLQRNGEDNWLQEQVFDIINKRYNNRKPTIFSSNYSLNELITDRGMMQKTVDRINEMSTATIKLTGSSYRLKNKPKAPF